MHTDSSLPLDTQKIETMQKRAVGPEMQVAVWSADNVLVWHAPPPLLAKQNRHTLFSASGLGQEGARIG